MTVLVAGGSGVFGRHLLPALRNAGHPVLSLGRGSGNDIVADLLDLTSLKRALSGHHADVVVHAATALRKPPMRASGMDATNELRITGTRNLLEASRLVGATTFIAESMAFGYGFGDHGPDPLTEHARFGAGHPVAQALRVKEQLIFDAGGCSLRYGLFYGFGGTDELVSMLRKRALPIVKSGNLLPWVSLHDAAQAVVAAIAHGRPGEAYNIVDEAPMSFGDHVSAVAAAFHTPRPLTVPLWLLRVMPYLHTMLSTNLRLNATKAHTELHWSPTAPSVIHYLNSLSYP